MDATYIQILQKNLYHVQILKSKLCVSSTSQIEAFYVQFSHIAALYICAQILEIVALFMYKFSNGSYLYTNSRKPFVYKFSNRCSVYVKLCIFIQGGEDS